MLAGTGEKPEKLRLGGRFRETLLPSQEFGDGFRSGPDLEFFVDAADVGVNGFVADAKLLGDFFVEKSVAEAVEHFLLALGKVLGWLW